VSIPVFDNHPTCVSTTHLVVQGGVVKIYIAALKALRKKKRQEDELSIHSKLVEKLVWVPVISFSKTFVPS